MAQRVPVYFISDCWVQYGYRQIGHGPGFDLRTPSTDSRDLTLYQEPECHTLLGEFRNMEWGQDDIKAVLAIGTWDPNGNDTFDAYLWFPNGLTVEQGIFVYSLLNFILLFHFQMTPFTHI